MSADLEQLRAALDGDRKRLCDALGLRPHGTRYFCPQCQADGARHKDGDFSIKAGFRCHKCGLSGDGFDIVRLVKGCDFPAAVEFVRDLYAMPAERPANDATTRRAPKVYPTLDGAARAACWVVGKQSGGEWQETRRDLYRDATGRELAAVLRFDNAECTAKDYRPARVEGEGWALGDPRGLWPLFNLPAILATGGTVYLCEGEKASAAGTAAGLLCTCTAHGAQSPAKTDFAPLAGRDVVILPDNDAPGREYAASVARLATDAGAASVRIVELPGLPPKGDLVEFLAAGNDAVTVASLAAAAPVWTPPGAEKSEPKTGQASDAGATGFDSIRAALWAITQEKLSATEAHRKSAAAVVEWLHSRGRFYHHAERRDFASVMFFDAARKLLLPVQGDAFLAWLADALAVNRSERVFAFAAAAVETEGLSERSAAIIPAAYWTRRARACYLSNGPGQMVRIAAGRVELVDNGADGILFPYGATLESWTLTTPSDPFEACALFRDMATAAPHGRDLFRLWGASLPSDPPCKPPACITAPAGAGKTALVRGLFRLYGLPEQVAAVTRNGDSDFWAGLDGGGIYCLDNADVKIDWLPDAAAAAATAGAHLKRRLYTDADKVTLRARAWLAITSLNPTFAADAGLADRLLVIRLNRRAGETAESSLFDEIAANRDAGLSWIAETLSGALADRGEVPAGLNQRHPDFAALAVRIGRAMGREAATVAALRAAESDKGLFNLENDNVGAALLELVSAGPFTGTAGELFEALKGIDAGFDGRLSLKGLGKRLSKLWPHVESTLAARKERDPHSKNWLYTFRPPSAAVFAVFGELFPEKSYARDNKETFGVWASETPQTPQTPEPDLFDNAEATDQDAEDDAALDEMILQEGAL